MVHAFNTLEPKFTPLKVCLVHGIDPLNWRVKGVLTLKFCTMRQPEKDGTVSLSSDTGATHVDFGSIAMLSAQYTLCFQAL